MFTRQLKKNQIAPETTGDQSRQRSGFNGRVSVSEAPATKTSAENRIGRTPWWHRLFGRALRRDRSPLKPVEESRPQQRVAFSDGPTSTTAPPPEERRRQSFWGLFSCCRRRHRVAPFTDAKAQNHHSSPVKTQAGTQQPSSSIQAVPVVEFTGPCDEEEATLDDASKEDKKPADFTSLLGGVIQVLCQNDRTQSLRAQQVSWLGFPNPAQSCYMNSCLQSLITLAEFVRDVNCQEEVWSLSPEAELMSRFMTVVRCHGSKDGRHKLQALDMFKRALSVQAPEFAGNHQNDVHEFLIAVLGQMRSPALQLQEVAAFMGKIYTCPVERNLMFKMQNTRTCRRCGAQSIREEEFTNLSLELVPGSSIEQMLQEYQMETEVEYNCVCGGNTSSRRSTFLTLPKFLMLHLKRFRFTQSFQLVKLHDPVVLFRELMVTSSQDGGWYSLVSVISHLGHEGHTGHYISEGVHPDQEQDAPGDRWLCYNDAQVTETTGAAVCDGCQQTAYILFYERQM